MAGRIGFDAKRYFFNQSGLGNYARTLVTSLLEYHPEFSYLLFSPEKKSMPTNIGQARLVKPESFLHKKFPFSWRSFAITEAIKREKLDIYHGLSNELPFNIKSAGTKNIVTIHDLIFVHHPELYPYLDKKVYGLKFKKAIQDADLVMAISKATQNDLLNCYAVPQEKICLAYQSCHPTYYSFIPEGAVQQKVKEKFRLPDGFMLYVGTVEERKNLLAILQAMLQLPASLRLPLVVVGGKRKKYLQEVLSFIKNNKLEKLVVFPPYVNDEELKYLYRMASLFVYPSIYEGFGLPVLESLLMGTPVITSAGSSLPEAAGPGSLLLENAKDPVEMAHAINLVLSSKEKQESMARQGMLWSQHFHPEKTSTTVASIYHRLLKL